MLKLQEIHKSYGPTRALEGVSLALEEGEIVLLSGLNGSGKTTLLRVCAGLTRADQGVVDCQVNAGKIAYVGHGLQLYGDLTVQENIQLHCSLAGSSESLDDYLSEWKLLEQKDRPVRTLSRGLQQRTSIARAFIGKPQLFLLDEPSSALDKETVKMLAGKLKGEVASNKGAAIIATHDVERLSGLGTRTVTLTAGTL